MTWAVFLQQRSISYDQLRARVEIVKLIHLQLWRTVAVPKTDVINVKKSITRSCIVNNVTVVDLYTCHACIGREKNHENKNKISSRGTPFVCICTLRLQITATEKNHVKLPDCGCAHYDCRQNMKCHKTDQAGVNEDENLPRQNTAEKEDIIQGPIVQILALVRISIGIRELLK